MREEKKRTIFGFFYILSGQRFVVRKMYKWKLQESLYIQNFAMFPSSKCYFIHSRDLRFMFHTPFIVPFLKHFQTLEPSSKNQSYSFALASPPLEKRQEPRTR